MTEAVREVAEAARTALWAGLHDPRMKAALAAYDAASNSTADPGDADHRPAPTVEGTGSASFNEEE